MHPEVLFSSAYGEASMAQDGGLPQPAGATPQPREEASLAAGRPATVEPSDDRSPG